MANESRIAITPEMKVSQLLDLYPQLETVLMEMSPAFSKLKNPVLRRTVARVTSLSQAARVGGVDLGRLINGLRRAAGMQEDFETVGEDSEADVRPPGWWDPAKISLRFDARPVLEAGEKPLERVMKDFSRLRPGEIYQLTAPFLPAPLMDLGKSRKLEVWSRRKSEDEFEVFFYHSGPPAAGRGGQLVALE